MVCNAMGGGSKDTWVIGKNEVVHKRNEILFPNRISKSLILSRVAESLFGWVVILTVDLQLQMFCRLLIPLR